MPVSGQKYVAPVWQNGGPPALDADALNAISQSIVRNQGDIGDLNTLTQQLSAAVGGAAKIEFGSYVGTGVSGAENPMSITANFKITLLCIYKYFYINGSTPVSPFSGSWSINIETSDLLTTTYRSGMGLYNGSGSTSSSDTYGKKSEDGKTFFWYYQYTGKPSIQFNAENTEYYWFAIGC